MSVQSELLSQLLDITKQLVSLNQKASINIRLGSDFVFSFNNQEIINDRKKSPSQIKRNFERNETFKNMKKETFETKNLEEKSEKKDSETQTEILVTSTGTNTDTKHDNDCNDDKEDFDENKEIRQKEKEDKEDVNESKEIRPKEKETILEMRINHDDLDKQKVATFISKHLKFSLIGEPWIANNGRHFATVGFKTWTSDYEKWKENSVNWRDSGIRAVYFSRLYQQ